MSERIRKTLIFMAALLAAAGIFGAGAVFGAGNGEPGTQGDPIVTLSYLESRLAQAGSGKNASTEDGSGPASENSGFIRVSLEKDQKIRLADGSMLIVYSGNGRIAGEEGMLNLSTGELFGNGTSAVLYSIFLGIGNESTMSAQGNMTLFVAGEYEIE